MASYFQTGNTDCLAMLKARSADVLSLEADVLAALATEAEADVFAAYTDPAEDRRWTWAHLERYRRTGYANLDESATGRTVHLLYYETDADDLDSTSTEEMAFLAAVRREVADIIVHRYHQRQRPPGVISESRGARSVTYAPTDVRSDLPPGFGRYLRPFVTRPPSFAI